MGILRRKDFPYLATLIIGLLGGGVDRISDRVTSAPTLELRQRVERDEEGGAVQRLALTNISRSTRFDSLTVVLAMQGEGRVISREYSDPPPASVREEFTLSSDSTTATLRVPVLQPGWQLRFRVETSTAEALTVRVRSIQSTVRLVDASFETLLVRHEVQILMIFTCAWIIILVVYGFVLTRGGRDAKGVGGGGAEGGGDPMIEYD